MFMLLGARVSFQSCLSIAGGGFTHISMDQNSQNQPNVQVGDSNVMVIGRSRYSDSDDEWKGQQISKKKSLKLPGNFNLDIIYQMTKY